MSSLLGSSWWWWVCTPNLVISDELIKNISFNKIKFPWDLIGIVFYLYWLYENSLCVWVVNDLILKCDCLLLYVLLYYKNYAPLILGLEGGLMIRTNHLLALLAWGALPPYFFPSLCVCVPPPLKCDGQTNWLTNGTLCMFIPPPKVWLKHELTNVFVPPKVWLTNELNKVFIPPGTDILTYIHTSQRFIYID